MNTNFYTRKLSEPAAVLAPMAGFSDAPFRKLCRDFGSSWAVTEMVSATELVQGGLKGIEIGEPYPDEPDLVIQMFGGEPELVAAAGQKLERLYRPQALDINMGCPVKKITGKSCGAKLMQDPERASEIVRQLAMAVSVPVSAKMRLGYDRENALELALALQDAGASLISIHGRTAVQKYAGEANWTAIADIAEQLSIPVVGSGDIANRSQFQTYRRSGLGVMVGRAAVGRPWLFAELRGAAEPAAKDIARTAFLHAQLHLNWYGNGEASKEAYIMRSFRSQALRYFSFLPEAHQRLTQLSHLQELAELIQAYLGLEASELPHTNALQRSVLSQRSKADKRLLRQQLLA